MGVQHSPRCVSGLSGLGMSEDSALMGDAKSKRSSDFRGQNRGTEAPMLVSAKLGLADALLFPLFPSFFLLPKAFC